MFCKLLWLLTVSGA